MDATILIVEDEQNINDILVYTFAKEGYKTLSATDGVKGLEMALNENPDLILLDIMLPGMDGYDVCKKVREKSNVPIIMLTAREDEVDKVLGLEFGADDYITKPYSVRELTARVKANLRRSLFAASELKNEDRAPGDVNTIVSGDLTINTERYEVTKKGKVIDITLREFDLLKFLAMQPDKIFSREKLLENVWGYEYYGDVRTVDVTVRRLREKIEDDPSMPKYIITKRGVGYYFNK
ncbi:MAG TPA: response regulator transcription factor [Candidatus Ornithomonoglobus intestinigallinarum]|uniref:Stage 0 sporulation protein A homolog n=1 Tax=Candidatus Ornithomonoglobus intestinigallinarum TaxID=2840894 RepID=A0A9D1H4H2_9FIRM|nr:response regulator transcription factor [Candidatus Ornithomonoglobus intestinigallinarum]